MGAESLVDGIKRATDVMLAVKVAMVAKGMVMLARVAMSRDLVAVSSKVDLSMLAGMEGYEVTTVEDIVSASASLSPPAARTS